jgi:D-alanyl-D-alanine carboxypeptidase (penicillin-binding protein 5/6)
MKKILIMLIIISLSAASLSCSNKIDWDGFVYNYDRYYAKIIYEPSEVVDQSDSLTDLPMISENYVIIDYRDNHILLGDNEDNKLSIASTTKILTAIIAIESGYLDDIVTVSSYAAAMPKVKLGITEGEQYYARDLLYAMMLCSYNDVSVAIAEHIAGSVSAFSEIMNQKAIELGALNSSFVTANGLDADSHYSTAMDMAIIASYAMKNAMFRQVVSTIQYSFNELTSMKSIVVSNINKYLQYDEDAVGIKTGFTTQAGYCFVGATEYENTILINTVLACGWPPNKNYKWKDTEALVDYVKSNFNEKSLQIPAWSFEIDSFKDDTVFKKEICISYLELTYLSNGTETVTEVLHILPAENLTDSQINALNDDLNQSITKGEMNNVFYPYEVYIKYDNVIFNISDCG